MIVNRASVERSQSFSTGGTKKGQVTFRDVGEVEELKDSFARPIPLSQSGALLICDTEPFTSTANPLPDLNGR